MPRAREFKFSHLQSGTKYPLPRCIKNHFTYSFIYQHTSSYGVRLWEMWKRLPVAAAAALNRDSQKHFSFLLSLERRFSFFPLLQKPKSVPPGLIGILSIFQIKEQKEKQQQLPSEMTFYSSLQLYKADSSTSVPTERCAQARTTKPTSSIEIHSIVCKAAKEENRIPVLLSYRI